jgi:hypothetical protein
MALVSRSISPLLLVRSRLTGFILRTTSLLVDQLVFDHHLRLFLITLFALDAQTSPSQSTSTLRLLVSMLFRIVYPTHHSLLLPRMSFQLSQICRARSFLPTINYDFLHLFDLSHTCSPLPLDVLINCSIALNFLKTLNLAICLRTGMLLHAVLSSRNNCGICSRTGPRSCEIGKMALECLSKKIKIRM